MKKNNSENRALQDTSQQPAQPDKVGWIRKYCGKGLFREIWKNRYVVLKGDKLYISEKEGSHFGLIFASVSCCNPAQAQAPSGQQSSALHLV
ncbi:pleckstrin homology domain-containing family O member 1b isoform X1 [Tachysurus ichikawai]